MNEVTTALKALSEEIRIRLLLVLMKDEACVCELMATFDMAQSKLSHHLIALRDAGFIKDEKRGKWNYYTIDSTTMDPMLSLIHISEPTRLGMISYAVFCLT